MLRFIHRLRHLVGWNTGSVETWWHGETLMVGFRCECGELQGVHAAHKAALLGEESNG